MPENNIDDTFKKIVSNFQSLDGQVVGQGLQPSKIRLADDAKGAVVNEIVDMHAKKTLTDKYLQEMKAEYKITTKEIMREIAKRQFEKVLGI